MTSVLDTQVLGEFQDPFTYKKNDERISYE